MGLNSKDLERLGPGARKQVLQKLGAQHRQREQKTGKGGNKYGARKAEIRLPDGSTRRFDSQKEADRYMQLVMLQRGGRISDLQCQVPFRLLPHQVREDGTKEQPVKYIADFVYRDKDGRKVVEDVKGYTDTGSPAYKLYTVKRKLMLYVHGITIREI